MNTKTSEEHSLTIKHINVKNQNYICISGTFIYDLIEETIGDKDMYAHVISTQESEQTCATNGYPKQTGEFIAYGAYFAPDLKEVTAAQVGIQVGSIKKVIDIIGKRTYQKNFLQKLIPTKPESFKAMHIGLENAYGGKDSKQNKQGRGYTIEEESSLANLFLPNQATASINKDDTILPAVFSQLPKDSLFLTSKAGTYDKHWEKTRSPYFASDISADYFNVSPPDQRLQSGYFKGNEQIIIKNMNPQEHTIKGVLPSKSIQIFVRKIKLQDDDIFKDVINEQFIQLNPKLDTITIFGNYAQVAVSFTATIKTIDDSFSDITEIFLNTHDINQEPHSLDYYDKLSRSKDVKPFDKDKHDEVLDKNMQDVSNISMLLDSKLRGLQNTTPTIHASPSTLLQSAEKNITQMQNQMQNIVQQSAKALQNKKLSPQEVRTHTLKAQNYGAMVNQLKSQKPVDKLNELYDLPQDLIDNIKNSQKELDDTIQDAKQKALNSDENSIKGKKFDQKYKNFFNKKFDKIYKKSELNLTKDLEEAIKDTTSKGDKLNQSMIHTWHDGAKYFIGDTMHISSSQKTQNSYNLDNEELDFNLLKEKNQQYEQALLQPATLEISSIAYNIRNLNIKHKKWTQDNEIIIPKGFVLTYFQDDIITKVSIRPDLVYEAPKEENNAENSIEHNKENNKENKKENNKEHNEQEAIYILHDNKKDITLNGSQDDATFILKNNEHLDILIVTNDIVKAWLLYQQLYDIATIIVVKDEQSFLDLDYIKQNIPKLVIHTSFEANIQTKQFSQYNLYIKHEDFLIKYKDINIREEIVYALPDISEKDKILKEKLLKDIQRKKILGRKYSAPFNSKEYSKKVGDAITSNLKSKMQAGINSIKQEINKSSRTSSSKLKSLMDKIPTKYSKFKNDTDNIISKSNKEKDYIMSLMDNMHDSDFINQEMSKNLSGLDTTPAGTASIVDKNILKAQDKLNDAQSSFKSLPNVQGSQKYEQFQNLIGKARSQLKGDSLTKLQELSERSKKYSVIANALEKNPISIIPKWARQSFRKSFGYDMNAIEHTSFTIEEFKKLFASKVSLKHSSYEGIDFEDIDFEQRNFEDSTFKSCTFQNCNLSYCNFTKATFNACEIYDSDLNNANFEKSILRGLLIDKSILDQANFKRCLFDAVFITNITAKTINFEQSNMLESLISKCIFEDTVFTSMSIVDSRIQNTSISKSSLKDISFSKTMIAQTKFYFSTIDNATFLNTTIIDVNFLKSSLDKTFIKINDSGNSEALVGTYSLVMNQCIATSLSIIKIPTNKMRITQCSFPKLIISNSLIKNSIICNCNLSESSFVKVHFNKCNLSGNNYMDSTFEKSFLQQVDLSKSNLFRVNLKDIRINQLKLKDSNLKNTILGENDNHKLFKEIQR